MLFKTSNGFKLVDSEDVGLFHKSVLEWHSSPCNQDGLRTNTDSVNSEKQRKNIYSIWHTGKKIKGSIIPKVPLQSPNVSFRFQQKAWEKHTKRSWSRGRPTRHWPVTASRWPAHTHHHLSGMTNWRDRSYSWKSRGHCPSNVSKPKLGEYQHMNI